MAASASPVAARTVPTGWTAQQILLSHDIHPNRGPRADETLFLLSLHGWGWAHLKHGRWGRLLQEVTAQERHIMSHHIIALEEVRFKSGDAHMAYTAKVHPKYLLLATL